MIFGGRPPAVRLPAAVATLIVAFASAAAEDRDRGEWDLNRLMQELAQVKAARGKFVERKHVSILKAPLEFSGTLVYVAPDRLEKRTLKPHPETVVLDRDVMTIEDEERNRRRVLALQDYPVVWAFIESIRSTLAGDLPTLTRFYEVALQGTESGWRLTLKPVGAKMQQVVTEIRIGGERARVSSIEILEPGGDRSVITVTRDADPASDR